MSPATNPAITESSDNDGSTSELATTVSVTQGNYTPNAYETTPVTSTENQGDAHTSHSQPPTNPQSDPHLAPSGSGPSTLPRLPGTYDPTTGQEIVCNSTGGFDIFQRVAQNGRVVHVHKKTVVGPYYEEGVHPPGPIPSNAYCEKRYYCRELDGNWTVRKANVIVNHLNPGGWDYFSNGEIHWVRHPKD